jgi:DNA-binding CsgD family transcriptional regulator
MLLVGADQVAPLVPWLDTAMAAAQSLHAGVEQGLIRAEQALALLYLGRADEAKSAALEVAAFEWSATNAAASAALSAVALELRDPELTEQVLARQPEPAGNQCFDATNRMLHASAAAAAGDFSQALDHILACGRQLDRTGWLNPVLYPWQTTAALLYHRLGDPKHALGYAEDARARAIVWGAPSAVGRALRTLGQVTPGPKGTELLREAVAALMASANVLELAKAQLLLGSRLHLVDDPAAEGLLLAAREIALDAGVPWLVAQAGRRLRPVSQGTPVGSQRLALTKSEAKVVGLAVGNHTNQEIAEILEVTCRAVEKHLTNSFRKLGIRRRTELAGVSRDAPVPSDEMLPIG